VEPLSPRRYRIEVTVGQETHDNLREIQELLSHQIPNGDPAAIIDRAIALLLEQTRKERRAKVGRPRPSKGSGGSTRHVPAEVRREVWERDGGQCAFVGTDGRRCGERRFIEVHHEQPFARGGAHTADNLELRCRAHNQHEANVAYGTLFMHRKRGADRTGEALAAYVPASIRRRMLGQGAAQRTRSTRVGVPAGTSTSRSRLHS
jgi:5-methylcytosine-specific restriction endonuclease McrA